MLVPLDAGSRVLLPTTDIDTAAGLLAGSGEVIPGASITPITSSNPIIPVTPLDGPREALATRTCAALRLLDLVEPVTVISVADACALLPAVARALRAQGRAVADYVLVEPDLPEVSDAWPDAPVIVFAATGSPAARLAVLRGWRVRDPAALTAWVAGDSADSA